jgi:transposase-like protein
MRKQYSTDIKVKVVLTLLKEEQTITQVASQFGIHVTQLRQWRQTVLEGLPALFDKEKAASLDQVRQLEAEKQTLFAEIGRLSTELTWLKKKSSPSLFA